MSLLSCWLFCMCKWLSFPLSILMLKFSDHSFQLQIVIWVMNHWAPKKPQLSASCKQSLRETQEMSASNSLTASQKNRSAANQAKMFASNATLKGGYNALQSKLMNLGVYFENSLYVQGADSLYCTLILSRRNSQLRHIYICMFICIYKFYFKFYEHILSSKSYTTLLPSCQC